MAKIRHLRIVDVKEPWTEAVLSDGTVVRARLVLASAHLKIAEDGEPEKNDHGEPAYQVSWQIVVSQEVPDKPGRKN